jgi:DNA transposition AAA+ family ATPase
VLIIDEAQNLPVPLLEEIRILSDLEAPEKLLQVVLVGQLELQAKLKLPEMRQVDQRVSVRCELRPMSRDVVTAHPGGSLDELLTVYSIVNALTMNLRAVTSVQVLVDGKEVDTLVGHVDLRRPLTKNVSWVE